MNSSPFTPIKAEFLSTIIVLAPLSSQGEVVRLEAQFDVVLLLLVYVVIECTAATTASTAVEMPVS